MLKRIIIISILLFFTISLSAGEFIGVGLHTGLQNDAGNLASFNVDGNIIMFGINYYLSL